MSRLCKYIFLLDLLINIHTRSAKLKQSVALYEMNSVKRIKASTFANLVATTLYEKRMGPYFVTPIVVGLDLND